MRQTLIKITGAGALVIGAVTTPTPLPLGISLMAFGLGLLVTTSKNTKRLLPAARGRHVWLDQRMHALQNRMQGQLGRALKQADGGRHQALNERAARRRDAPRRLVSPWPMIGLLHRNNTR